MAELLQEDESRHRQTPRRLNGTGITSTDTRMDDEGFDSLEDSTGKTGVRNKSGAHSGARGNDWLAKLAEVWPALGNDVRCEILRLAGVRPYDFDDFYDLAAPAGKSESR